MGRLGFGERLLRFVFVDPDRRMVKVLTDVPIPKRPDRGLISDLMAALREIQTKGDGRTTVAVLLTRPGVGAISDADRRWSSVLNQTAAELGVPIEPIFRANDEHLVLVEPA